MFEKIYSLEIFRKTCLSSKSFSGNFESRSYNSPDNFPPKVRFFHKILKNSPLPPILKKKYQTELFSRNKIFPGEVYLDK